MGRECRKPWTPRPLQSSLFCEPGSAQPDCGWEALWGWEQRETPGTWWLAVGPPWATSGLALRPGQEGPKAWALCD